MIRSVQYSLGRVCAIYLLTVIFCLMMVLWLHELALPQADASLVHHVGEAQGGTAELPAPGSIAADSGALYGLSEAPQRKPPMATPVIHEEKDLRLSKMVDQYIAEAQELIQKAESGQVTFEDAQRMKFLNEEIRRLIDIRGGLATEHRQEARGSEEKVKYLRRAKMFLAAGDYRRALDACLFQVWEQPSVESYVYLTYVYHAINGYLEHLAKHDRWVTVGHLYLNLAARGADDLVDPPDVLSRMAKEIMHEALQKQSDISAAMATRLDRNTTEQLWQQQAAWRKAHPDNWWAGVPKEWAW